MTSADPTVIIQSPLGVFCMLAFIAGFFFWLEKQTDAKLFHFLPPLLFIYATPVLLGNLQFMWGGESRVMIPNSSVIYTGLSQYALPAFIVLMLIKVNIPAVVRVMGRGVLVMLMGTAGVVVGAVVSYLIVHQWLSDDAWKGYGALAGSWIGGTANLLATSPDAGNLRRADRTRRDRRQRHLCRMVADSADVTQFRGPVQPLGARPSGTSQHDGLSGGAARRSGSCP